MPPPCLCLKLFAQIPNCYLMPVLPASKYLGTLAILWGVIVMCTSLAKTFPTIFALRFLLGMAEAPSYCISYQIISVLYRRREHVLRIGVISFASGFFGALGGLISYGIGFMDGVGGLHGWRWVMIICGACTLLWGSVIFLFLPDSPTSRWFALTPEEERIVEDRLRDNSATAQIRGTFTWSQMHEAIRDPKLYAFLVISIFVNFPNSALNTFRSQIISQMGFSVSVR